MAAEDTEEGEVLTGAELFHYLTRQNEHQLTENRRKLQEYTKLQDVLQNLTDRCRVPILAPVSGGMAYFEATMDYTNNILVLLGDGWFAERSAKQAHEIAGRRLEFLRREENALMVEASALMQRQNLFLSEVHNAERAMAEVEAMKADALHGRKGKGREMTTPTPVPAAAPEARGEATEVGGAALQLGLEDQDLAVIDEFDFLTEEELLQIEEELGEKIEDDELVERVMTERLIAKKEKRVREELRKEKMGKTQPTPTAVATSPQENTEQQSQPHRSLTTSTPTFTTPGDIGRVAASVMGVTSAGNASEATAASSAKRRVRFSDLVDVVPPEGTATTAEVSAVSVVKGRSSARHVLGEVVEHDTTVPPCLTAVAASTPAATSAPKRTSLFRSALERGLE